MSDKPALLLLEFWGIGDLTFTSTLLRHAVAHYEVTVLGKEQARALLAATFPEVHFIAYDPPWTAFRGKYRLWKWDWRRLLGLLWQLRRSGFDCAVSVRPDPRDHLMMWLAGARRRLGFPRKGSQVFLTDPVPSTPEPRHRVEDWRRLGLKLGLAGMETADPFLDSSRPASDPTLDEHLTGITRPIVLLHTGARILVRRWPAAYFSETIRRMREEFDFELVMVSDPTAYGPDLADLCDRILPPVTLAQLIYLLGKIRLLMCNDSGPGHVAAACGTPACVFFGPGDPTIFRPWGEQHHVVIRDICEYRPCYDYCHFAEPYCLTRLLPEEIWPELRAYLAKLLPSR